jgi:hypothetical protein
MLPCYLDQLGIMIGTPPHPQISRVSRIRTRSGSGLDPDPYGTVPYQMNRVLVVFGSEIMQRSGERRLNSITTDRHWYWNEVW